MPNWSGQDARIQRLNMSRAISVHLSTADPVMGRLIEAVGPYRLSATLAPEFGSGVAPSPFGALARAITSQQLNGTAARAIFQRFAALYLPDPHPRPEQVLLTPDETLRAVGLSRAKIAAIRDLAAKILDGTVPAFAELERLDDSAIIERVSTVRGIGRWTVEMLLIFQLGRPDVLPIDDLGVRTGFKLAYGLRSMPPPAALAAYGTVWRPHRSAAAWYLWRAVELAREGRLPAPAKRIRMPRVSRRRRKSKRPPPRAAR
jgi:DNA-3-methyladenine glycosylase II